MCESRKFLPKKKVIKKRIFLAKYFCCCFVTKQRDRSKKTTTRVFLSYRRDATGMCANKTGFYFNCPPALQPGQFPEIRSFQDGIFVLFFCSVVGVYRRRHHRRLLKKKRNFCCCITAQRFIGGPQGCIL